LPHNPAVFLPHAAPSPNGKTRLRAHAFLFKGIMPQTETLPVARV